MLTCSVLVIVCALFLFLFFLFSFKSRINVIPFMPASTVSYVYVLSEMQILQL